MSTAGSKVVLFPSLIRQLSDQATRAWSCVMAETSVRSWAFSHHDKGSIVIEIGRIYTK